MVACNGDLIPGSKDALSESVSSPIPFLKLHTLSLRLLIRQLHLNSVTASDLNISAMEMIISYLERL